MHSVGIAPVEEGPLFSEVLAAQIREVSNSKGEKSELVGIYKKVGAEFIAIVGDRPVGGYRRSDLQTYAKEISWLPPNASSAPGYRHDKVKVHIERNKKANGQGLAAKSVGDGRVSHLKAILARGCEDADVQARTANTRINIPDRARPPRKHKAPDTQALSRVLNVAVDTEGLSTALLLVLGALTGRRVSLLATLRREDVMPFGGAQVIEITTHRLEKGEWSQVQFKTDDSRECIVVPDALVAKGFVDWAKQQAATSLPLWSERALSSSRQMLLTSDSVCSP